MLTDLKYHQHRSTILRNLYLSNSILCHVILLLYDISEENILLFDYIYNFVTYYTKYYQRIYNYKPCSSK